MCPQSHLNSCRKKSTICNEKTCYIYLYWLTAKNHKALCTLHQETRELVGEDALDFIGLLNGDADTQGVDRGLDQDTLLVVAADHNRVEQDFLGCSNTSYNGG